MHFFSQGYLATLTSQPRRGGGAKGLAAGAILSSDAKRGNPPLHKKVNFWQILIQNLGKSLFGLAKKREGALYVIYIGRRVGKVAPMHFLHFLKARLAVCGICHLATGGAPELGLGRSPCRAGPTSLPLGCEVSVAK